MTHSFRLSIYLDFTDSIDFYRKIHADSSVHPKMKTDFRETLNLLTIELQLRVEGSNNLLSLLITFLNKSLEKPYLFFKIRFKVFFGWPTLARFLSFPSFSRLDLPPFQNNLSSTCSYFPEKPIDKNRTR